MKLKLVLVRINFAALLCCAFVIGIASFAGVAQTRGPVKDVLPRVGTIKDYPATGLMTGCGNLYFYPASRAGGSDPAAYIFLARGDGSNAWMNLGGRDVRLRQVRMPRGNRKPGPYYYRLGRLRISVLIEAFKPEDAPAEEGDSMFKMRITLRKGRAVRIVRAVGDSDC